MGARTKLNQAFFNGSLVLASIAGAVTGSWLVFGLALAALIAINIVGGENPVEQAQALIVAISGNRWAGKEIGTPEMSTRHGRGRWGAIAFQ